MRPAREAGETIGDVCFKEHSARTKAIAKKINLPVFGLAEPRQKPMQKGSSKNKSNGLLQY